MIRKEKLGIWKMMRRDAGLPDWTADENRTNVCTITLKDYGKTITINNTNSSV